MPGKIYCCIDLEFLYEKLAGTLTISTDLFIVKESFFIKNTNLVFVLKEM